MRIRSVTKEDFYLYLGHLQLRGAVLRTELGLPPVAERFPYEEDSICLVAYQDKRVLGCLLIHPRGDEARLYQMAVHPDHQGSGIGRRLIERAEEEARKLGVGTLFCNARWKSQEFYARMGWVPAGEPFMEVGITHQRMEMQLSR